MMYLHISLSETFIEYYNVFHIQMSVDSFNIYLFNDRFISIFYINLFKSNIIFNLLFVQIYHNRKLVYN